MSHAKDSCDRKELLIKGGELVQGALVLGEPKTSSDKDEYLQSRVGGEREFQTCQRCEVKCQFARDESGEITQFL